MATLRDSYTTGDTDATTGWGAFWSAQVFTASSDYFITSVKLLLYRIGTPQTITVSIRAVDIINSVPTGADLTSGTTDGDTLTTSTTGEWREVSLTPLPLISGTKYAIVFRSQGTGVADRADWRVSAAPGGYSGGNYSTSSNSGVAWSSGDELSRDQLFETYSEIGGYPVDIVTIKRLVAFGYNEAWYEDSSGSMASLSVATGTVCSIDTTDQLVAFEGYSKAFVANGSILKVADFINTRLTTCAVVSDATEIYPIKGTVLTGGTSGAVMVCDYITAATGSANVYGYVTSGTFVSTDTVTGTNATGSVTAVSFSLCAPVVANPHWYDWTVYPGGTYGSMPSKAYLGCLYRGRAVLSGNPIYPNQWYMSRQANPWDWAYAAADSQSPVAGNNADAGQTGDIIRCLVPYGDDYLLFGCASEIWILRGDPAAGGSMDRLTSTTGIFGAFSWCFDTQRNLYFWGNHGIYKLSPDFSTMENISQNVLPNLVKDEGINPNLHRITMGYDQIREGLLISITTVATGSNSCYWYDLRSGGFFPESYPVECAPYSMYYYNSNAASLVNMLVGGSDGRIRVFDDSAKDDDIGSTDQAISSKALIGPLQIATDVDTRSRMNTITVVTGRDTDSATLNIYGKDTAEEIVDSYLAGSTPFNTVTLGAGRTQRFRPRTRASYLGLAIENTTSTQTWNFEKAATQVKPAGEI